MDSYDIIVVGAGISGATIAERFADQQNKKVLVIEKRDHLGGNCYDFMHTNGVRIGKYGAHIFHTNNDTVWNYVQKFSDWYPYEHKVLSAVDGHLIPVPVNINTVNTLFNLRIETSEEMDAWLEKNQVFFAAPQNSEEMALSRVGRALYEKMFRNYTKKQWDQEPALLDSTVLARIPVRNSFDSRYFTDTYQALPLNGYTALFEKMLDHPNIHVITGEDFFALQPQLKGYERLFFTGRIDQYFASHLEPLQYRSLRFESTDFGAKYYQPAAVVNHPQASYFTRIVEYKHFMQSPPVQQTTVVTEFPTWQGEPYYPVPNPRNQILFSRYQALAKQKEAEGIYFVGRLANYKYFNMDEAFKNALDLHARLTQ